MKNQNKKIISLTIRSKENNLDTIRYAAYAVSDAAYVFIKPAGPALFPRPSKCGAGGGVTVEFTPKLLSQVTGHKSQAGTPAQAAKKLLERFREELKDEKLRAEIFEANRDLREFMILKALAYEEPPAGARQEDAGLTPEQEKELDALIAQVESEIKKESAGKRSRDPLGITRTWEEKYGAKNRRKKN